MKFPALGFPACLLLGLGAALASSCARTGEPADLIPPASSSVMTMEYPSNWGNPAPPSPPMIWVPAENFRRSQRTPETVTAIVIHTTEGRFDSELSHEENQERHFHGVVRYLQSNNRNVSAHYVLGPKGEIVHMVNENDVAHTQTYYNGRSFGIECAGWGRRPETWTPEMMESLVDLCAYLAVKWEIPAYQPEGTAYEGPFRIVLDDGNQRFTGPGLVGHYQVQPWNKSDPGPHFDWEGFAERVRERIREFGAEPIPLPVPEDTTVGEIAATARIKEDSVRVGEPFTYVLTIQGSGISGVTADDLILPLFDVHDNLEVVSGPERTETPEGHVVFEVGLQASAAGSYGLTASRVNLRRTWADSQTVSVRVAE